MTRSPRRHLRLPVLGALLVGAELIVRFVIGDPYPGATAILVLACGVSMLPLVPPELDRVVLRVAVSPSLGIVSFAVLLTTISIMGARLDEVTIRVAVAAFVAMCAGLVLMTALHRAAPSPGVSRAEALATVALAVVLGLALASAWDVVGAFPPGGVDWGHYLLYADEVEVQRALLVDDPYAGEDGRLFADSPGVGALYGAVRILDGTSSERLIYGIVVVSAVSVLSVFVAAAALWRLRSGVLAAAVWAVAPIHIDPIRWHGVGTTLALIFLPLVVLALGLLYRGSRGWRVIVFLGVSLLGVGVTHSTSTFLVGFVVAAALVVDLVRQLVRHGPDVGAWWREGITRPVLAALALAAAAGVGVLVHLRAQASELGSPVGFEHFEPDWLSWDVVVAYYSLTFLIVVAASVAAVLFTRELRRDAAMLAVVALMGACVVVAELWRLELPFEYRRAVFYAGLAMTMVIGAAATRLGRGTPWMLGAVVMVAYVAHQSIGLRMPERLLAGPEVKGTAAQTIARFGEALEHGDVADASVLVADRCHNFVVPYLLRRPTIVAFEPWQVGFASRVPLAARASAILEGGPAGRRLAASLGVGYVIANPTCTPDLPRRLGGSLLIETPDVVIVDVRARTR